MLFHNSSKFDFCIGVEMVMCHALLCVKEIHQLMTGRGFRVATSPVVNVNQHFTKMSKIIKKVVFPSMK